MAKIINISGRRDLSRHTAAPAQSNVAPVAPAAEGQALTRRGILLEFPKMGDGPLFAA